MFKLLINRGVVRRSFLALPFILGLSIWLGGFESGQTAEKVVFGLDWRVYTPHAGYYVALDKGFYKDEGLDVEIVRGYGSADAVKRVAAGALTFSFGDTGALVMARAEGIKVKAVAMIYGKAPHGIWCLEEANIKKPEDLYGKTIGAPAGGSGRVLFPTFAKLAKIDASKVKWLTVDPAVDVQMVFGKRNDCATFYAPQEAELKMQAKKAGLPVSIMRYADYGVETYSNALLATEETINKKPDVVRKFVKGTLMGLEHAFKNPDIAATILKKHHPELDEESIRAGTEVVKDLALTDEAKANGLGYMSAEKMKSTRDVITEMYNLKVTVPYEDLYTNQFLPKK